MTSGDGAGQSVERELEEVARAIAERARLKEMLRAAKVRLAAADATAAETRRSLDAETADVLRLEGFSFARLAANVRGTRADDLMRERGEQARAESAHATATSRAAAARTDVDDLTRRLEALSGLDARRRAALEAKAAWLSATGHPAGARLDDLSARLGEAHELSRQVAEALAAARTAGAGFDAVLGQLGTAESWATFDLFGGGILTDLAKHSHIDEAQRLMADADAAVRRLQAELADVGEVATVDSVGVTEGTRLMDYFFDDIFSAMSVRNSLIDSRARVVTARDAVQRVEQTLRGRAGQAHAEITRLSSERDALLEG
ncbi:hypothetical protein ACTVCO_01775 [Sanguibacter sp. A247]|uniref:hypothetical protein n=1 Tax=unclassified Sanguibacter TaxID=2645534 RepID=UPI003FD8EE7B